MTHSIIREATIQDVENIEPMLHEMHSTTSYSSTHYDKYKVLHSLFKFIEAEQVCVFVAESEGELVGLFMGIVDAHWWGDTLTSSDLLLYVPPEHRKKGFAGPLINKYIQWSLNLGVPSESISLGITTDVDVERTSKFYESVGFRKSGVIFDYKG